MTGEMTDRLRPERYRSYLIVVARMSLRRLGPLAHKVGGYQIRQMVVTGTMKAKWSRACGCGYSVT